MNLLFINHFAGIPKKSDASLRHFNIAKIQQKYNNQCSIITSSKSYQSQEKLIENRNETGTHPWLCEEGYGNAFLVWGVK